MIPVAVITGMQSEAKCFGALTRHLLPKYRPIIRCAGVGPDRATAACNALNNEKISGLVSFGIAGGLDASLSPGCVQLPAAVVTASNERFETDFDWHQAVGGGFDNPPTPTLQLGANAPITEPDEKARFFAELKTHAVDMESHAVADYAKNRGVPFLVLRAVADTADVEIPEIAFAGLDPAGNVAPFQVVKKLVRNPGQLPALLRLARNTNAAMTALQTIPSAAIDAICMLGENEAD